MFVWGVFGFDFWGFLRFFVFFMDFSVVFIVILVCFFHVVT